MSFSSSFFFPVLAERGERPFEEEALDDILVSCATDGYLANLALSLAKKKGQRSSHGINWLFKQ